VNEWRQRLDRAVAETLRRRQNRAAVRQQLDRRRQAGLAARHATKLARSGGPTMTTTAPCVICSATTEDPAADGWTDWILPEPIEWRSAFTHTGQEAPTPAGRYTACPACTNWIPRHRAGNMPAAVQEAIHAAVTQEELHPMTRRQLHAELVGRIRHLGAQLHRAGT
jgi:hypothetical protein